MRSYEATLNHGRIEWLGEQPDAVTARVIVTVLEEPSKIRVPRQTPSSIAGKGRTLGDIVSPLFEDAVEHQRKMDRYDRLMRDLRGKVRIGRKLTRDELNER